MDDFHTVVDGAIPSEAIGDLCCECQCFIVVVIPRFDFGQFADNVFLRPLREVGEKQYPDNAIAWRSINTGIDKNAALVGIGLKCSRRERRVATYSQFQDAAGRF